MRILVAEDEALIAMMLTSSLEDAGHEVLGPAATLTEALALSEAAPPHLALLDIDLRDGSSGVNVARALFRRWRVPSIFVSAQSVEPRAVRDVAIGQIRKPYEPETVLLGLEVARRVMAGGRAGRLPHGLELFCPN